MTPCRIQHLPTGKPKYSPRRLFPTVVFYCTFRASNSRLITNRGLWRGGLRVFLLFLSMLSITVGYGQSLWKGRAAIARRGHQSFQPASQVKNKLLFSRAISFPSIAVRSFVQCVWLYTGKEGVCHAYLFTDKKSLSPRWHIHISTSWKTCKKARLYQRPFKWYSTAVVAFVFASITVNISLALGCQRNIDDRTFVFHLLKKWKSLSFGKWVFLSFVLAANW